MSGAITGCWRSEQPTMIENRPIRHRTQIAEVRPRAGQEQNGKENGKLEGGGIERNGNSQWQRATWNKLDRGER
jgi:hypothetical protein